MVVALLFGLFVVFVLGYLVMKHYMENGYYFPLSRKYGVRRYVFPRKPSILAKLGAELKKVCRETLNGELLEYSMLQDEPGAFEKRVVCVFYDRNDQNGAPIAFHAPFLVMWKKLQIFHCGLMMVVPQHQRQGIQSLTAWNVAFYFIFRRFGVDVLTEIAASSSYLTIQDNSQDDAYPVWQKPEVRPKQWHIDIARFMVKNYSREFGCSKNAELQEDTLVVRKSNEKEGGGAWQLIKTVETRKSSDSRKGRFIESRLNNNEGDEQFFVGKPNFRKAMKKILF